MTENKKNLAWLIFIRLLVVSLFLASITYFNIRQPDYFPDAMLRGVTRLIIFTYVFSIFSLLALRYVKSSVLLGYAQIVWESLFVSILVIITGGITSTYSFFFNLAIINASFLFGRREALCTAGLCGVIYGAILDLHYYGKLERFALFHDISDLYGANHVLALIFTNLLAFFLTAILTGFLAERARESEKALKKKEIDYEELESVNSIIVSTLDSGLVTVNSQGKIRVFNRYAAELTGIEQLAAYDLPFSEIFPEVDLAKTDNLQDSRHESIYKSKSGEKRILGVKSAPLLDKEGHSIGAVVDMLDVTDLRAMESRLKRADRLAAIGELSARIAHEVRNPLASISGSVQLIAESGAVPEADKKLLAIIQRETARLDSMLSEFLQYARPFPPVIRRFSLKNLITELSTLLQGDSRFSAVKITDLTQEPLEVHADHDQIRQTVWNLLLNAAESMPDGGEIRIESHLGKAASSAEQDFLFLSFTDTGCGIDPASMVTVFEPFFTTKQGGTGLGLANVYRILEAHKGSIAVESQLGSGTRFTISLPLSRES